MANTHSNHNGGHKGHHIVPDSVYFKVFWALIAGTVITVATSYIDFGGSMNIFIAMAIATTKAMLVTLFFMGLKYDSAENNVTFFGTFFFLVLFVGLTSADIFMRKDPSPMQVDAAEAAANASGIDVAKYIKPTPDLEARGKAVFTQQCVTCHGDKGDGNGPAGAAFNPKPRNFTVGDGWKNGRTIHAIVKTLSTGLNSMPNFSGIPAEDRMALAHYVRTLAPSAPADSADDVTSLAKLVGGGGAKPRVPVEFMLDRMSH